MSEAIGGNWPGLLLLLVLLALVGLRAPLVVRGRLFIKAPIDRIFGLIDLKDGEEQHWHRAKVNVAIVDAASQTYRIRYAVMPGGSGERIFHADFRVREREQPVRLVLDRAGLEGRSRANELLTISAELAPEGEGTRLALAYHWGPRALIGQLLARTDLYGSLFRIKTLAETGTASSRAETVLAASVAGVTGLVTLAGFGLLFGWAVALLVLVALALHEFGHLLAFRLVGQPWGRLVFLPFLGGMALPRLPFRSDGQHAFAALMGPGLSVIAVLPSLIAAVTGWIIPHWLIELAGIVAILNLFNLMPVEPLDGGVVLRIALSRFLGSRVHVAMMISSGLIALVGLYLRSPVVVLLGLVAAFANFRPRASAVRSVPLRAKELALMASAFVIISAAHILGLETFFNR
jgi:Zn-dependent protease